MWEYIVQVRKSWEITEIELIETSRDCQYYEVLLINGGKYRVPISCCMQFENGYIIFG